VKQRRRHPIWAAVSGFFLGLFVALDLLFLGVIPLNSVVITLLPIVGLVLFAVLGFMGPLRKKNPEPAVTANTAPIEQYVPPPPPPTPESPAEPAAPDA
jgi:hypothetical protein